MSNIILKKQNFSNSQNIKKIIVKNNNLFSYLDSNWHVIPIDLYKASMDSN